MPPEGVEDGYAVVTEPSEAREEYVTERLREFNRAQTATSQADPPQPLHVYLRDTADQLVGGVIGRIIPNWGTCEITVVWVHERLRGQGWGRRLMAEAEAEALRCGCRHIRLNTADYQAPGFYRNLGYEPYGQLEDWVPGQTIYYLHKPLPPQSG